MEALVRIAKRLALCGMCLITLGQNAFAQMPEGTLGWWYLAPGSGNYAPDPVTACQLTARNHMGTDLVEMRRHPTLVWYDCKYPHFLNVGGVNWYGSTYLECASGYVVRWPGVCTKITEPPSPLACSAAQPGYVQGDPVVVATGDQVQIELDPFGMPQDSPQISRIYRSTTMRPGSLGVGWSFDFDRTLETSSGPGDDAAQVYVQGDQGSFVVFSHRTDGAYDQTINSGTLTRPNAVGGEFAHRNASGRIDYFNKISGNRYRLVSSFSKEGVGQFYTYDANNHLQTITDSFGRTWQVVWNNDYVIDSIIGPDVTVQYQYDRAAISSGTLIPGTERLTKVLVKDAIGTLLTTREYLYEDPRNRYFLTGITDENANRYATIAYDGYAKTLSSEHAGGADRHSFTYPSDTSRTVTDPLGSVRTINITNLFGFARVTSISQPGGAGCTPGTSSLIYHDSYLSETLDFNGNKTCYYFDTVRYLETGRVEGFDAASNCPYLPPNTLTGIQRKILTQWHPDERVVAKLSAPKSLISYIYNGQPDTNGQILSCAPTTTLPDAKPILVVCKRIEQATSDNNGALGFNAAVIGRPRVWSFTYNAFGQMLTSNGPANESGSMDTTAYTYYADTTSTHTSGNLRTVTNAMGHLTEYLEYNKSGKVTRMRDPNGNITAFTYDPQSRMRSRTQGPDTAAPQTTTFDYDGVGQLIKVTAPDASFISYAYDPAHRLTDISDGLGNSIHYTLDNAGNRIREEVKDVSGNLRKQVSRTFDPLNRLQQVTGASQ